MLHEGIGRISLEQGLDGLERLFHRGIVSLESVEPDATCTIKSVEWRRLVFEHLDEVLLCLFSVSRALQRKRRAGPRAVAAGSAAGGEEFADGGIAALEQSVGH